MDYIWDHMLQMLPPALVGAAAFFCLRPWRRRRLAELGRESGPWREAALLFFVMFSVGLAALTLTPQNFWPAVYTGAPIAWPRPFANGANLVPIVGILYAVEGMDWLFLQCVGNVVMCMPFGFFPSLLWARPTWKRAALIGFSSSSFIESVQLFIDRGTDIDDLILNTLGALGGCWLCLLLRRLAPSYVSKFICHLREVPHGC